MYHRPTIGATLTENHRKTIGTQFFVEQQHADNATDDMLSTFESTQVERTEINNDAALSRCMRIDGRNQRTVSATAMGMIIIQKIRTKRHSLSLSVLHTSTCTQKQKNMNTFRDTIIKKRSQEHRKTTNVANQQTRPLFLKQHNPCGNIMASANM